MKVARTRAYDKFTRLQQPYLNESPARRPLKIFALDPLSGQTAGNRAVVDVPNEPLAPGPIGERIKVIDYDGTLNCFYAPVNLDEPPILMQSGLEPSESDPRFHQQMVYAVAMRVLENFERALGRNLRFAKGRELRILPHVFRGANAFFDPPTNAVMFGYFSADEGQPGQNLPGQTVFSCLSHDIVAHEVTHAMVFRLREHFSEPTNPDVLAFHEAIADIVAIFQHFTFADVLRDQIQKGHGDVRAPGPLLELAKQFGHGTGRSEALRSALEPNGPNPNDYKTVMEPHARGSLLVAAVFDTFFSAYQARIVDIVRVATGGTGRLPKGDLHPDLVGLMATQAARAAQSILTMCIRAFEYLPPVDVTYGDYLRALVTADFDLFPDDEIGQRAALIEAFRLRGIYPSSVNSLAEESLVWGSARQELPPLDRSIIGNLMTNEVLGPPPGTNGNRSVAGALAEYGRTHADALQLEPEREVEIQGFHPTFRIGANGRVRVDIVAQFVQERPTSPEERAELGGLRLRSGTTVIFSERGEVRYLVAKPLPEEPVVQRGVESRSVKGIREFIEQADENDDLLLWRDTSYLDRRMLERANFAALHRSLGEEP